jgi:hypothetical protein
MTAQALHRAVRDLHAEQAGREAGHLPDGREIRELPAAAYLTLEGRAAAWLPCGRPPPAIPGRNRTGHAEEGQNRPAGGTRPHGHDWKRWR